MKSFWSNFFSSLLALFTFSFISFIFIFIIIIALIIGFNKGGEKIKEFKSKSILVINTNQIFDERDYESNPIENLFAEKETAISIHTFEKLIKQAANNNNISAILIKSNSGFTNNNTYANYFQAYNALLEFKKSGKKIYAYGNFNEKDYFISSIADKIYAMPLGNFEWNGLSTQLLFFKNMMDKLDLKVQIFYAGKFKSATEPFRRNKMSEENRLQISTFLGSFRNKFYEIISKNRQISIQKLIDIENEFKIKSLEDAQKYGFIDGIMYSDEVQNIIKKDINIDIKTDLELISLNDLKSKKDKLQKNQNKNNIAVIYADGEIISGKVESNGKVSADNIIEDIREAQDDDEIKAIVLRINSPGGDAQASEKIWRALTIAKTKKPLIVSMGALAASGGYYIASASDKIFANPFTITGSIGVFAMIPDLSSFLDKKLGVTHDEVGTSKNSVLNIFSPLTIEQQKYIQNHINNIYTTFKKRVSDSRNLDLQKVEDLAQGRVWSGVDALKNKLVDSLCDLNESISYIAKQVKIENNYNILEYPKIKSNIEKIINNFLDKTYTKIDFMNIGVDNLKNQTKIIKETINEGNAQIKIPFVFQIN